MLEWAATADDLEAGATSVREEVDDLGAELAGFLADAREVAIGFRAVRFNEATQAAALLYFAQAEEQD